jgi:hypothetical protein
VHVKTKKYIESYHFKHHRHCKIVLNFVNIGNLYKLTATYMDFISHVLFIAKNKNTTILQKKREKKEEQNTSVSHLL